MVDAASKKSYIHNNTMPNTRDTERKRNKKKMKGSQSPEANGTMHRAYYHDMLIEKRTIGKPYNLMECHINK